MTLTMQIVIGTILLLSCAALHIEILRLTVLLLKYFGKQRFGKYGGGSWLILIATAFLAVVFSHTIQVWLWAVIFLAVSALDTLGDAIYFSLVTYTTLGYGDVTVGEDFRIFAAMAAVTGLLNFGLSTAFLVGLFSRLLPEDLGRD